MSEARRETQEPGDPLFAMMAKLLVGMIVGAFLLPILLVTAIFLSMLVQSCADVAVRDHSDFPGLEHPV